MSIHKRTILLVMSSCLMIMVLATSPRAQLVTGEALLDTLSSKYDWIQYRLAVERWELLAGNRPDSLMFFEDLARYTFGDIGVYKQLQAANAAGMSAENRRKLTFFLHLFQTQKIENSAGVRQLRDSVLAGLSGMTYVLDGAPADSARLGRLLRTSADRAVREKAYRALLAGDAARADQMAALLRLRNQEAKKDGYNTYAALSFSNDAITLDDYGRILAEVERQTQAAYDDLLGRLRAKIGGGQLEVWDIEALAGGGLYRYDYLFTVDTLFPSLLAALGATGFEFDDLPIYYQWTDSTAPFPITSLAVRSPLDQRLIGFQQPGHESLKRLLGQTGLAIYSAYVRQDDALFNRPLEGPMRYAVERLFGVLPDNSRWLQEVFGMSSAQAEEIAGSGRDMHLLTIRRLLAVAMFELEIYRNPTAKLNDLYWSTFERILAVPKHADLVPAATDPSLVLAPFEAGRELLGWVIAAQTWDYLRDFSGTVVTSRDTRAFLVQNYFRFGSRFEWPELLERGTGSPINAAHLDNFIKP